MLSIRGLRVVAAASTVLALGGGVAIVASDPKPEAAPLHPSTQAAASLVIPQSCGVPSAVLTPGELAAYTAYTNATTAADRRAALTDLTPQERQQVTAYIRSTRGSGDGGGRRRGGGSTGGSATQPNCEGGDGGDGGTTIDPGVITGGGGGQTITSTYAS